VLYYLQKLLKPGTIHAVKGRNFLDVWEGSPVNEAVVFFWMFWACWVAEWSLELGGEVDNEWDEEFADLCLEIFGANSVEYFS